MASIRDQDKLALFGGKPKDGTDFSKPKPKQDALGNKILDPEEELRLIEREMQEVKIAFDQFFLGFERKSPMRRRDVLGERIRKFRSHLDPKAPAGFRFRLEQAQSKFAAYDRIWTRNLNDKEAKVSKLKEDRRNYVVLNELNTQPRTTYLASLKNQNKEMPDYKEYKPIDPRAKADGR